MAVLPTPGSPISTGLFLVRRDSTCMTRSSLAHPADDRVELLLAGQLGEVAPELVEHEAALLGLARRRAGRRLVAPPFSSAGRAGVARQQLDDLLAHPGQVGAELDEHLGGDALALADEAEQDVLGADVVVAELQRLAQRQLEHLLGARREGDVPRRRRAALPDDLLDLAADGLEADVQRLERLRGDALTLVDEAEEDVLGADVVVVEEARFLLGEDDHPAGPVSEAFEQGNRLRSRRMRGEKPTCSRLPERHCATRASASVLPAGNSAGPSLPGMARGYSPLLVPSPVPPAAAPRPRRRSRACRVGAPRQRRDRRRRTHRDRGPPHRGRRQAVRPVAARSWPPARPAPAPTEDVVMGAVAVELVHLGSLYHDDVMDEADTRRGDRERERPLGQPQGHPRRRLPAGAGVGDRRLARHGGRRPAGPHDRLAVRGRGGAAPPRLRHDPHRSGLRRVDRGQDGVAVLHGRRIGGLVAELPRPMWTR